MYVGGWIAIIWRAFAHGIVGELASFAYTRYDFLAAVRGDNARTRAGTI